jgi:hypothetical protein
MRPLRSTDNIAFVCVANWGLCPSNPALSPDGSYVNSSITLVIEVCCRVFVFVSLALLRTLLSSIQAARAANPTGYQAMLSKVAFVDVMVCLAFLSSTVCCLLQCEFVCLFGVQMVTSSDNMQAPKLESWEPVHRLCELLVSTFPVMACLGKQAQELVDAANARLQRGLGKHEEPQIFRVPAMCLCSIFASMFLSFVMARCRLRRVPDRSVCCVTVLSHALCLLQSLQWQPA